MSRLTGEVLELWARFLSETFRPGPTLDPKRFMRTLVEGQRIFEQTTDIWLRATGLVPRNRYLEVLEENDRLKRKVAELEARLGARTEDGEPASVEGVFDEMLSAQRRWAEMWMPRPPRPKD